MRWILHLILNKSQDDTEVEAELNLQGTYCLIISVPNTQIIDSTALGSLVFKNGTWLYIGSAQGTGSTNLKNRLLRHFRNEKVIHWHIDHLLASNVTLVDAIWAESSAEMECKLAQHLESKMDVDWGPKKFGASDCKNSCGSHTLYYYGAVSPVTFVESAFTSLGMNPYRYSKKKPITA